jgi:hypothetical protein
MSDEIFMSEQERLSQLVNDEDFNPDDPLGSQSLLFSGLESKIGKPSLEKIKEIEEDIKSENVEVPYDFLNGENQIANSSKISVDKSKFKGKTEDFLIKLFEVYDDLVVIFEKLGINNEISEYIILQINKISALIEALGGEIDPFVPVDHISGLDSPNLMKNAERVIETTLQCYKFGNIDSAHIENNGKTINIVFSGEQGVTKYVANGTIDSNSWVGNEAIDYVYTPGSGKMSVKAFENNKWINKYKDIENYKIVWELEESEMSSGSEDTVKKLSNKKDNSKINNEKSVKEELKKELSNQIEEPEFENNQEDIDLSDESI